MYFFFPLRKQIRKKKRKKINWYCIQIDIECQQLSNYQGDACQGDTETTIGSMNTWSTNTEMEYLCFFVCLLVF